MQLCHTHVHSMYSIQDGITEPEAMMKKAADHGMGIINTEHGSLTGIWECAKYAKKYGVKWAPGIEVYCVPDVVKCRGGEWANKGSSGHLVLNAVDDGGWRNLLALNTKANFEGSYYQPRVDYKMLREHSDGIWCSTACLGSAVNKCIKRGESPHLIIGLLHDIYQERFSLEIQLNTRPEQEVYNDILIKVGKDLGIPLIATVDSHYLEKSDSHKQDLVFCMGMKKLLNDPDRHRYPPEAHSLETPDVVIERFTKRYGELGRKAIARTVEVADQISINFEVEASALKFPSISVEKMADYQNFIEWKRKLIATGES